MNKTELRKLSLEELEAEQQRLMRERDKIRQDALKVQAVYDEKAAAVEAERKLANMSQAEREAMAQYIEAHGIESEEVVGD